MEQDATQLLTALARGNHAAADKLLPIVYEDLHRLAHRHLRSESSGHTLRTTALVDEVFVRLISQDAVTWESRAHFFSVAAIAMRNILVDHARKKQRHRRGRGRKQISLDEALTVSPELSEDVLMVNEALERLADTDPRDARIVELRFFAGLSVEEVAAVLDMPKRNVERRWTKIRAWLRRELEPDGAAARE